MGRTRGYETRSERWTKCCDPLLRHPSKTVKKGCRPIITKWIVQNPDLELDRDKYVCTQCRLALSKRKGQLAEHQTQQQRSPEPGTSEHTADDVGGESTNPEESSSTEATDATATDADNTVDAIDESAQALGATPIVRKRLRRSQRYRRTKLRKIRATFMSKVASIDTEIASCAEESDQQKAKCFDEMLDQLREKFNSTNKPSEKIRILTAAPRSWSIRKLSSEFGASQHQARCAKRLQESSGCLSGPNPKPGKVLNAETASLVRGFYTSEELSREMPGAKDFVSIRNKDTGKREHVQKRLILCNLKEAYRCFKDKYPEQKIGFSKFAELRPKERVLAGASGTHCVCVCVIHENVKLMMDGARVSDMIADGVRLQSYHHCLCKLQCNPPSMLCKERKCVQCPKASEFAEKLLAEYDSREIDCVEYRKWTNTDRSTLETITETSEEFVQTLCEQLELLVKHEFVASSQGSFLRSLKENLNSREVIVLGDFAENYSMVTQDEIQSHHWNKLQATIHPFVAYWRDDAGEIQHLSYAAISDCLTHDTVAVHMFQRKLVGYIETKLGWRPNKIYYFSDGAAAQYKNCKNFVNLTMHDADFGVKAEWHFFATAHGKSPCDGIGGTLKRLAKQASLRGTLIETPLQFYHYLQANVTGTHVEYFLKTDWIKESETLHPRFAAARTVPGTRNVHCVCPSSRAGMVVVKWFSGSATEREVRVTKQ